MEKKLQQLIEYAKHEKWEEMDALIPEVCDDKEILDWSLQKGVSDTDGNIRDLAVSLLEKSNHSLRDEDRELLEKLMVTDKNIYVQFRAAFTLFNRGIHTNQVMDTIQQALKNEDVKDIAEKYLATV